jgi:hypothetical protein
VSLTGGDLGILGDLAKALGLLGSNDNFNSDWLNAPGDRLKQILADDTQRAGLVSFVDEALAGSERVTDPAGLVWLPVFERAESGEPHVRVYVVLDEHPADHVRRSWATPPRPTRSCSGRPTASSRSTSRSRSKTRRSRASR